MFDVSQVQKRYFDVRLSVEEENGEVHKVELKVEPPTVKKLRQLMAISKGNDDSVLTELRDGIRDILSKNKIHYKVPDTYIDNLDFDQLTAILTAYMEWLAGEKRSKN